MSFPDITADLARAMPELRGKLLSHVPLGPWTWFKTGGPAQAVFQPEDAEDLAYFLAGLDPAIPVLPLGQGSICWCATAASKASSSRSVHLSTQWPWKARS